MLLYDEYKAEFPNRNHSVLNKFASAGVNLHETALEQINAVTGKWDALSEKTADDQRGAIRLYLAWLKTKGVEVSFTADDVVLPLKQEPFVIYDNKTLHETWGRFFKACDRQATINGANFSETSYSMSYAIDILSFYGLTIEQIIELDLSDVQPTGIIGYDLPLTEKDMDILLDYKNLENLENRKKLTGHKYLRSAGEINLKSITMALRKAEVADEDKWLKSVLTYRNVFKLGVFSRMYETEKNSYRKVRGGNATLPEWFTEGAEKILGRKPPANRLTQYKKEYLAYKAEREENSIEIPVFDVIEPEVPNPNAEVIEMLGGILADLERTQSEIRAIMEKLK